METLSQEVFTNAYRCNYDVAPEVELYTHDVIKVMKATDNPYELVCGVVAMTDQVLYDIQQKAVIHGGAQPTWVDRTPALLARAAQKFIHRLNPITQVHNMGTAFIDIARFASTVTIGKWYLSEAEYAHRINGYWSTYEALSLENFAQLTAEQWFDLGAEIAADMLFGVGVSKVALYLKEINAVAQTQRKAVQIAQRMKRAVDVIMKERPIVVTVEGAFFHVSDSMGKMGSAAKEILQAADDLIMSLLNGQMANVLKEVELIRKAFHETRLGFGECANKYIKVAYEHILGVELVYGRKGVSGINGFHHDFMNVLEKNGVFQFINKEMYKGGFYSAEIWYKGKYITEKTFFPSHWSRQEVAGMIMEVYDTFKGSSAVFEVEKNGKYVIREYTKEGIKLKMHVTKKGVMTSAYPIFKEGV